MKNGFSLMEFLCIFAIVSILFAIIIPIVAPLETKEQTTNNTEVISDNEILNSRKYILEFDSRMERANEQIYKCTGAVPDYKVLRVCTSNAYNAQGWEDADYGKGTVLKQNIVEEYNKHKFIAMKVLSTEL